jgi:hypothetical protein
MIKIYVNEDSYIVNCETGEIYSQDEIEKFISSNVKVATMNNKKTKKNRGYAEKYKTRKRLSRKLFPFSERVLTWPELWKLGVSKNE